MRDAHRAMTVESIRWRLMTLDFEKTRWGDVGDEIVVEMPDDFREGDVTITYGTTGGPASTWLRPKQGGPALYAQVMKGGFPTLDNTAELPETMQNMLDAGASGILDGKGFYQYKAGDREKWEDLFRESVWHTKQFQDKHFPLEDE